MRQDRNGSLVNIYGPGVTGPTSFAYNPSGLVAKIRRQDASSTYFFYDGNLQRYALNINGTVT